MFEASVLIAFAAMVSLIVVSPGPNLFLLLYNVPAFGRATGFFITIGFSLAIMMHATLSLIGVGAIIATSATLFTMLKLAGAAYLIWLGVKSIRNANRWSANVSNEPRKQVELSKARAMMLGFLTNALNPKPALFYLAAFPQFISPDNGSIFVQGAILTAIHVLVAIIWYGSVVLGIDRANTVLRRPMVWKYLQSISGVALIGLGIKLATVTSSKS